MIAFGYFLYTVTRNSAPPHVAMAHHHATAVYAVERWLHIDVELTLNHLLTGHHLIGTLASYYYATLHFAVTLGLLIWVYRAHPEGYRSARTLLVGSTLLALFLFWIYPLAPPRLSGLGFVDTIGTVRLWGGATWNSPGVASISNEYAAMPSLHVAWALWSASVVLRFSGSRLVRRLMPVYPLVTLYVVLATANHFVLDAVGAVAVLATIASAQTVAQRHGPGGWWVGAGVRVRALLQPEHPVGSAAEPPPAIPSARQEPRPVGRDRARTR